MRALRVIERRLRRLERINAREEARCRRRCERVAGRNARWQDRERERRSYVETSLESHLRVIKELQAEVSQAERADLTMLLEEKQRWHIAQYLRSRTLRAADIPGVRGRDKLRLWLSGIHSAADVNTDYARVLKAIPQGRTLVSWRAAVQADAKRTMPRSLQAEERQPVITHYGKYRTRLLAYEERVLRDHARVLRRLTEHDGWMDSLADASIDQAVQLCDERSRDLEARMAELREELPPLYRELMRTRQRLEEFGGVRARTYLAAVLCPWLLRPH